MTFLVADLLDLVLPNACAGCRRDGPALCGECRAHVGGDPVRALLGSPDTPPCWAGGAYGGPLRELVIAYKERRRHELASPLGDLLAGAVLAAVRAAAGRAPVQLVPIPSARAVARARGGDHVRRLAGRAVRRLRRSGVPARVTPSLVVCGQRRDSVGLSAAERRANVAGTMAVRGRARLARDGPTTILVDDLVTTGATLAEAARVLAAAGHRPVAAAALAATLRKAR